MNNKSSILLFLAFLLVGLGTGAQCNGTPEPPVLPISPIELPMTNEELEQEVEWLRQREIVRNIHDFEDTEKIRALEEMVSTLEERVSILESNNVEAQRDGEVRVAEVTEFYAVDIHWDDPAVPEGHAEVHCLNLPEAYLQVEWKVTDTNGLMVASGSEPVDLPPPTELGTGKAAGPVLIQADLPQGEYTVWHRLRWVLVDAECTDAIGQPITEITPGVFVPAAGETTYQDAEGYWYTVERSVPPQPIPIYLPLITKDDFE